MAPKIEPHRAPDRELMTVTQLAQALGITARAIRFYEAKELIAPSRAGTTRVYTYRELARMKLILRGKRLGFTLREIKTFLDLYDVDTTQRAQMSVLLDNVRKRRTMLERQREALTKTLDELAELERQAMARLEPARSSTG